MPAAPITATLTTNQKMSNETNFQKAKMNINSALTKNYEMNSPAVPAKTKPILPALKRQLSRIRPHSRGPVLSLPAVSAVEPSKDNSLNLKSEICDLKSRLRLTPIESD